MLKKVLLIVSLLGIAGQSWALPFLEGDIAFGVVPGASWKPTGGTPTPLDPNGISTATGIEFVESSFPLFSGLDAFVTSGNGDFSGTVASGVDFHDFNFDPLDAGQPTLWSFASGTINYELKMTTANIDSQSANQINLNGSAVLTANGFADTNGTFQFTANNSGGSFSYSSSAEVPEPASLAVFGIGLLSMSFSRIRRRNENI